MELIARYRRVFKLAEFADLGDDAAYLVVLVYRLPEGGLGDVDAVDLAEWLEYVFAQLLLIMLIGRGRSDEGDVHHAHEKLGVHRLHEAENVEIFVRAVHHLAGLGGHHRGEKVVSTLDAALKDAAGEGTCLVGHVVGADVGAAGSGGAQAHGEAAGQVQQDFGDKIAGVAQRLFAVRRGLFDKLVVRVGKETLKIYEVF